MTIKLILSDGSTVISGLTRNGNNYVSDTEIDSSLLTDEMLSSVTVSGTEAVDGNEERISETWTNATLVQQVHYENHRGIADGWYLVFREKTAAEIEKAALLAEVEAQAEYITDLELALTELYEATV